MQRDVLLGGRTILCAGPDQKPPHVIRKTPKAVIRDTPGIPNAIDDAAPETPKSMAAAVAKTLTGVVGDATTPTCLMDA